MMLCRLSAHLGSDQRAGGLRKEQCLTWRGSRTTELCRNSASIPLKCLFSCASVRPCLAPRLWPPGSPPARSFCYRRSLFFFSLPFPPPHTSSLQNWACLALPRLRPPYCHFSPHYTSPQPQPGQAGRQAGSPAGGPDGVLASGPALGSLSLQDGSAALLWPIWPRPVLAPAGDYGPAGRRQSWHWKRCQCAAE